MQEMAEKTAKSVPVGSETGGKAALAAAPKKVEIPKGQRKSGRSWKDLQGKKKRIGLLVEKPRLRKTLEDERREVRERKEMQRLERELKQRDAERKAAQRMRAEEHRRRREANEKKNEVVQIITNTRKLKRLSKRQMRDIRPVMDSSILEKKSV